MRSKTHWRINKTILLFAHFFLFAFAAVGLCAENLVPNPDFLTPEGDGLSPFFWYHGSSDTEAVKKSAFSVGPAGDPPLRALGIKGGQDRSGQWWCSLEGLEKGKRYRLSFRVYREEFVEGLFPEVELFGSRIRMSNLLTYGAWQDFGLIFVSLDTSTTLRFINDHPFTAHFSSPVVTRVEDEEGAGSTAAGSREQRTQGNEKKEGGAGYGPLVPDPFPLVVYGAGAKDFPFVRDVGFNGVVIGVNGKNAGEAIGAAARADLKIVANVRDDRSVGMLADSGTLLGWYVEDEPEGRSVPAEEITDRVKRIRQRGFRHPTFMAMVRPEFVRAYKDAADIILMDQYPVPHNPLIWLSKSMDEARHAGAGNVWAVVQIFGGQGWKGRGWDREPGYDEMKALSYLAIVHGARGLFFYTVRDAHYDLKLNSPHLDDVKRLLRELGSLSPYFLGEPAGTPGFFSDSLYAFAPDGTKPVHARIFTFGKQKIIIAVNVLDKEVEGRLTGLGDGVSYVDEYFSGRRYVVKDRNIVDGFRPYEVKVYIAGKEFRKLRVRDGRTNTVKGSFYAEVAASAFETTLGLMFRDLPSEERALLLMNEESEDVGIHALNMKIPFDVLFIDDGSRVSAVYEDVPPCREAASCRNYTSATASRMVLEMKAGTARKLQIDKGDRIEFY